MGKSLLTGIPAAGSPGNGRSRYQRLIRRADHKHCFAYEAHTVCVRHNFILDTIVTSGNVHDSVAFDALYEKVARRFPQIRTVTMDAGYKTPWICKRIIDDGRIPSLPYKRPMTKSGFHEWYKYVYDKYLDIVICPEYKSLPYSTTNRKGYREYKSLCYQCEACQTRHLCTESRNCHRYATGYTVTADYTGEVAKTNCEIVTYTAIFGCTDVPYHDTKTNAPQDSGLTGSDTSQEMPPAPQSGPAPSTMLSVLGCAGGIAALLAAGGWSVMKLRERRSDT